MPTHRKRAQTDKNFDTLFERFSSRIYGSVKGTWRLKLLQEDLGFLRNGDEALRVWDAGCGMGQMALWFAEVGHAVVCNDISAKMLECAKENFVAHGLTAQWHQASAQALSEKLPPQDLVLFHAVLEWLAKPEETLRIVAEKLKSGGYLSLLFYNYHSFIYRNALKAQWRIPFIYDENNWYGKGRKLTPPHPQKPERVLALLEEMGFETVCQTGIRVFHDYIEKDALQETDIDALLKLEYRYCRQMPYVHTARYIHILAKKRNREP